MSDDVPPDVIDVFDEFVDGDIEALAMIGSENLSREDLRVFNYLLILEAFEFYISKYVVLPKQHQCTFTQYLSCWLQQHVQVGLNTAKEHSNRGD